MGFKGPRSPKQPQTCGLLASSPTPTTGGTAIPLTLTNTSSRSPQAQKRPPPPRWLLQQSAREPALAPATARRTPFATPHCPRPPNPGHDTAMVPCHGTRAVCCCQNRGALSGSYRACWYLHSPQDIRLHPPWPAASSFSGLPLLPAPPASEALFPYPTARSSCLQSRTSLASALACPSAHQADPRGVLWPSPAPH